MLIGDTVPIVAKHYSGWIYGRQERLTERMITALSASVSQAAEPRPIPYVLIAGRIMFKAVPTPWCRSRTQSDSFPAVLLQSPPREDLCHCQGLSKN